MLAIGLTGGIGAGKSEAAGILRELGAVVIDADLVGHETYRRGEPAWDQVVEAFGPGVVGPDGQIDRSALGRIVFGQPGALRRLTDIVWPRIRARLEERIAAERARGETGVLVIEAAVLFEAGWDNIVDETWAVVAPEGVVLERLERQRNLSPDRARARLDTQMTDAERKERADVVVRNDTGRAALAATVRKLWADRTQGRHDG